MAIPYNVAYFRFVESDVSLMQTTAPARRMIDSVIAGLIANAITAFFAKLGRQIQIDLGELTGEGTLGKNLRDACDNISEEFEWSGPGSLEEVCLFLATPDCELTVRQIFDVSHASQTQSENGIQESFLMGLALYLGLSVEEVRAEGTSLFQSIKLAALPILKLATEQNHLAAHEALSDYRQRVLLDEIAAIARRLDLLQRDTAPDVSSIIEFEARYRDQVAIRNSHIIPPNFDNSKRVPLEDIFIFPRLIATKRPKVSKVDQSTARTTSETSVPTDEGSSDTFELLPRSDDVDEFILELDEDDLDFDSGEQIIALDFEEDLIEPLTDEQKFYDDLTTKHRFVVLGDPGAGKTTVTSFLCHQLATRYDDRIYCNRKLTPIHVTLRHYAKAKEESHCSLLDFIKLESNSKYHSPPPDGAFEYMFLSGRALLILDGLDELLETSSRREIVGDVEVFCNLYPETPIVVTSRKVGYDKAPLDPQAFAKVVLGPLTDTGIQKYVSSWFQLHDELTEEECERIVQAFLKESEVAPELRTNPLMLSLLCTIYRGEGYIPSNLPKVLEKCAIMLFEKWDSLRQIDNSLPYESELKPVLMYLADWIYHTKGLAEGVTVTQLINEATKYLAKKRYECEDRARNAATKFVEYCIGRKWVLSETGSTPTEGLFQFTHRTFLEYFTAAYLSRTNLTPGRLTKKLIPRIADSEQDLVTQLAFHIKSNEVEDGAANLLRRVIKAAQKLPRGEEFWNLSIYALRCLSFLAPHPSVTREIIYTIVEAWVALPKPDQIRHGKRIIAALASATTTNRRVAAESIEAAIEDLLRSADQDRRVNAVHLLFAFGAPTLQSEPETQFANDAIHRILERNEPVLLELADVDLRVALLCFENGLLPIRNIVERFGLVQTLGARNDPYQGQLSDHDPFSVWAKLFAALIPNKLDEVTASAYRSAFSELTEAFQNVPPPWITRDAFRSQPAFQLLDELFTSEDQEPLPENSTFVLIAILGAMQEIFVARRPADARGLVDSYSRKSKTKFSQRVWKVLAGRQARPSGGEKIYLEAFEALSELGLTRWQMGMVNQWFNDEVNFSTGGF